MKVSKNTKNKKKMIFGQPHFLTFQEAKCQYHFGEMQRLIFEIEETQNEARQPKNVHQVLAVRR